DGAPYDAPPRGTRVGILALSVLGLLVSGYLSAYKLGFIDKLTCQVGSCDRVQNSPWAQFLGLPVSLWGMGAYLTLIALAAAGLTRKWGGSRWVPIGLVTVSTVGILFSAWLTWLEAFRIHAWCQWCVISAILITIIFLLSTPEAGRMR
ncbi:MAG TPA: vitamin K epoxide reductase family protein, partial [Longimicrobium sp.]|nr:vitamin K epoxide reductase family protein [Longimicrobium sp.]